MDGCLTSLDHRRDPTDRSLFHLKVFMKQMKKGGEGEGGGADQAEYMRGRQEGVVCPGVECCPAGTMRVHN
jgi:hypothetical protein